MPVTSGLNPTARTTPATSTPHPGRPWRSSACPAPARPPSPCTGPTASPPASPTDSSTSTCAAKPPTASASPGEAQRAFLVALGVPDQEIPAEQDARTDLYRSTLAGLRLLIVLDDVADSDQVRPLLPGTPGALVLVTSRDRLGGLVAREGARPLELADLSPAEAREALVRRVDGRRTGAGQDADDAVDSVDDVAAACARLPPASAAAGANVLRPDGHLPCVASEFRARAVTLDEFTESGPNADIRGVFAWWYRQLAPDSARMFRLLALHPGFGIAATTAASLAGVPLELARELLGELARAQLLTEEAPDLYVLHDLLAAYARELLRGSDREDQRGLSIRRMLDHYVHTARAAATQLAPQRTEQWPLPRLQPRTTPEPLPDRGRAADWLDRLLLPVLIPVAGRPRPVDCTPTSASWGWRSKSIWTGAPAGTSSWRCRRSVC